MGACSRSVNFASMSRSLQRPTLSDWPSIRRSTGATCDVVCLSSVQPVTLEPSVHAASSCTQPGCLPRILKGPAYRICSGSTSCEPRSALLAHSLPDGTFSWADAQAMLFAKRECPASPSQVIRPEGFRPEMVDFPRSAKNVACARLWGADEQPLRAELAGRCYALNENCVTCDDRAMLEKWASMPPPFRFPTSQVPSSAHPGSGR